jgi:hypothetical protein
MLRALEQIRRMDAGGAPSHLMRCDDGYYCVVKFQNNPQHPRVLVNELLGTRLAARLGLPTVSVDIVAVSEGLIRLTPELAMDVALQRAPSRAGAPGSRAQMRLYCSQVFRQARLWERVGVYFPGRSHAPGLQLPTQRHARVRAVSFCHPRSRFAVWVAKLKPMIQ